MCFMLFGRIPLSTVGSCLMLLPGTVLIGTLLIVPWFQRKLLLIFFNAAVVVVGLCTYGLLSWLRKKFPSVFNPLEVVVPKESLHQDDDAEDAPLVGAP